MRSNLSHLKNYLIMVVATYVLMALYYMTIGYKETVAEYLEIGRLLLTFYFFFDDRLVHDSHQSEATSFLF